MSKLRRIIMEEVSRLLSEAYYGDLYHSTTLSHLYNMLDMNTLYSVSTPGSDSRYADKFPYGDEADAICLSRSRNGIYQKSINNAVLTLDGWRLSTSLRNARIHPYDYQEGRDGRKSGEMEERLYFADIYPLSKYCKRIDIYVEDIDEDDYSSYCDDAEVAWKSLEDRGNKEPTDRDVNEWFLKHIVEDFPEWRDRIEIHHVGGVNESVVFESADGLERARAELDEFKRQMAEKYGTKFWFSPPLMKRHPEIEVSDDDIARRKELYGRVKSLEAKNAAAQEEPEETEGQRWYREAQNLFQLAKESYGTTYSIYEAGFILPDGSLLDFGEGSGTRATDHRNIEGVYTSNGIEIWDDSYRFNYVADFMNHGAIRCDANNGMIDLVQEPTSEQYQQIKQLVQSAGGAIELEFSDKFGNSLHYASYGDASPRRVEMDIYRYFNEGLKPSGDYNE